MGYEKAWDMQRRLWSKQVEGELSDLLLILGHPHVITLGRRGNRSHFIASSEVSEEMKIPLIHVERDGDVTYHGPGQMVVYPILDLKEYGYRLIDISINLRRSSSMFLKISESKGEKTL